MDIDDPTVPEFAEWNSYELFAQRVRKERRFATDEASRAFIQTVLATVPPRATPLDKGLIAYRAQIGSDWDDTSREDGSLDISIWGWKIGVGVETLRHLGKAGAVVGRVIVGCLRGPE